jgi:hypothetical protein
VRIRILRRAAAALVLSVAAVGLAFGPAPVSASHWSFFGGDAGRSGHQPVDPGTPPVEPLWSLTEPGVHDVLTSVLISAGPPGQQRIVFGTGDRRSADGDIIGGRVHVRTLAAGVPITPPEGIRLSDEPDAFGDGIGSVSFADTSTEDALGQVWMVYNDTNGVSLAQFDEASGQLVQKRPPNPADVNDKLVGITVNSSVLLSPPDPRGGRALFFVAFTDVTPAVETLYKVSIADANSRQAQITTITTANGNFNLVDYASPSLVYLTANASNNEAHVAVGDDRGKLYTFSVDDLAPGPIAPVGAANDFVLTASAPVTATGAVPGAPGSGLGRTPVLYVPTTDSEGRTTRVYRLIQETSIEFRRQPDNAPMLPGGSANSLAVDAVVTPGGTLAAGGRVYVATGKNLYALDARDVSQIVARFSPDDSLVPGDTGFSQTSPAVSGGLVYISRDNGEQLVLDKTTLAPLPAPLFRTHEAAQPSGGSLAYGQPSISGRTVVFGTTNGVFAYRSRAAAPPIGYWLAAADGGIFAFGDAGFFGSTGGMRLNSPIVGMAPTATGNGYWLVARDGGVFAFGDAAFVGSAAGITLNAPVVGLAPTRTGLGYWLVAADGAVLAFGDATFLGSAGGLRLAGPVVGLAPTPTGQGYWLAGADGAVFSYGDAAFHGSATALRPNAPVVGIMPTPAGSGYWLAGADGAVFSFGAAPFFGSAGGTCLAQPVVGVAGGGSGRGYTLAARDGGVFSFGDAAFYGSTGGMKINRPVVAVATKG